MYDVYHCYPIIFIFIDSRVASSRLPNHFKLYHNTPNYNYTHPYFTYIVHTEYIQAREDVMT